MDLRSHRRYEVKVPVHYAGDEIRGSGTVTNLSIGGCTILGDVGVRVGSFVEVTLRLPDPHGEVQIPLAAVRYCMGEKFGLDFLQLQPGDDTRLRKYLKSV